MGIWSWLFGIRLTNSSPIDLIRREIGKLYRDIERKGARISYSKEYHRITEECSRMGRSDNYCEKMGKVIVMQKIQREFGRRFRRLLTVLAARRIKARELGPRSNRELGQIETYFSDKL